MNGKLGLGSIITLVAAASAISSPAQAADVSPRYAKAPAPLLYNWTGFYVGANFGGAISAGETVSTPLGVFASDPSGVLGGVQAGYNYMFAPDWLIGIEGEFDWTAAQGIANYIDSTNAATLTSHHNFYDTLDARLGYVLGPWLFFAKGGAAWMNADYMLLGNGAGLAFNTSNTINTTRPGWTIGAGAEYMLSPYWSVKAEYDYLDFGNQTFNFGIPIVGPSLGISTRVHEVKFGVNYHWLPENLFGGL